MKKEINPGDPQPFDCPKCKRKDGYYYKDTIKGHCAIMRNPDGSYNNGFYEDNEIIIRKNKTAYCSNCNTILPFKINRN